MRKIRSKEDLERKNRTKKLIIGIVLVTLMIMSTVGFAFINTGGQGSNNAAANSNKFNYNGVEFILGANGFWQTEIKGAAFNFQHSPYEIEELDILYTSGLDSVDLYSNKAIYFISDLDSASQEIAQNMAFASRIQNACLPDDNDCDEDLPIKTCEDLSHKIIIIKEAEHNEIGQNDACVNILTNSLDAKKTADAFLYKILGII